MTEAGSRRFWITLILGFFAIDITIAVVAITMAAGDPSFRSIPGFGKRSVQWSERQQGLKQFKESGLRVEIDHDKSTGRNVSIKCDEREWRTCKWTEVDGRVVSLYSRCRAAASRDGRTRRFLFGSGTVDQTWLLAF